MTHYLVQLRDRTFVKNYGFLPLAKNMGNNFGKNINQNVSNKYSQKLLDHAKKYATVALKTASKRAIQKIAETNGDLIDKKMVDKIMKVSKASPQSNSGTVTN